MKAILQAGPNRLVPARPEKRFLISCMRKRLFAIAFMLLPMQSVFAHGMTDADKNAILDAGYGEYLLLGAKHMLTGYDHLLFLFGVVFFLPSFTSVLKFITAFTLGHCITLISATLLGVRANYFLIDAVIAMTVIYKGFDNIGGFKKFFKMESPPSLLGMVFAFGLIHGFGLSTRLQQLPLGDGGVALVLRILSFNLGVEVGQVLALSVMLVLLARWRPTPSFDRFSWASNIGLMWVGFMLLLMQLHGYSHTSAPDDYPLNKDDHFHVHQDMAAQAAYNIQPAVGAAETMSPGPVFQHITNPPSSAHDHGDGVPHVH